jgi:hypothetical protein
MKQHEIKVILGEPTFHYHYDAFVLLVLLMTIKCPTNQYSFQEKS